MLAPEPDPRPFPDKLRSSLRPARFSPAPYVRAAKSLRPEAPAATFAARPLTFGIMMIIAPAFWIGMAIWLAERVF